MRQRTLRRTLGLIVSLAGSGSVVSLGCGGPSGDSSGSIEGGGGESGHGEGVSDAGNGGTRDSASDDSPRSEGDVPDSNPGNGGSETGNGDDAGYAGDSASAADCGAPTFQCSGVCVCTGSWVVDSQYLTQVSSSTACDLMKQAWPNGGNVPFGNPCQSACADTTAMQCAVADAYYAAFQAANQNAGLDASSYVCPAAPDGSATVALTCDVEHLDPQGGCRWTNCTTGRRPEGLRPTSRPRDKHPLAAYFGDCAHLEAASIVAFERMRAELGAHGAPPSLLRSARRAARDETRHARVTRAFAKRFGAARAPRPTVSSPRLRPLVEMAVENAAEGVVRETFGAAMALWQARHAHDAEVRCAMRRIAKDECRHADLSWRVARWLDAKLTSAEKERVARAIHETIETLRTEIARSPGRPLREVAGLPTAHQARALFALLERDVWVNARHRHRVRAARGDAVSEKRVLTDT